MISPAQDGWFWKFCTVGGSGDLVVHFYLSQWFEGIELKAKVKKVGQHDLTI